AVFLWLTRHRFSVYILTLSFVAANVLNLVLKVLYDRPRPDAVPTIVTSESPAFPSGHALSAFAIYGTLAYLVAPLGPTPPPRSAPAVSTWASTTRPTSSPASPSPSPGSRSPPPPSRR